MGHVTPEWELQSYRAVTLRERECNQRHAARDCENTGVYVFTCVNARGIKQLRAKGALRGYRSGTARLLWRERVESKGPRRNRHRRRADARVASAAVAVKGLRFASMNALESGAPLTAILAAAVLQL